MGPAWFRPSSTQATKDGFVPLEALNLCRDSDELGCLLRNEPLAGDADTNGDGDATDPSVIELRDRRAGVSLPIGFDGPVGARRRRCSSSRRPPSGPSAQPILEPPLASSVRPLVVTDGACAALLFAEPWENAASPLGIDANGDGEAFEPDPARVLSAGRPAWSKRWPSSAADAAGLGSLLGASGAPRSCSRAPARCRRSRAAASRSCSPATGSTSCSTSSPTRRRPTQRVDLNALGQPAQGPASAPVLSSDGDVACFRSSADLLASGSPNTSQTDIYCRDLRTGAIELATRSSAGSSCGDPIERANASSFGAVAQR